jgi:hypothetical protein
MRKVSGLLRIVFKFNTILGPVNTDIIYRFEELKEFMLLNARLE